MFITNINNMISPLLMEGAADAALIDSVCRISARSVMSNLQSKDHPAVKFLNELLLPMNLEVDLACSLFEL